VLHKASDAAAAAAAHQQPMQGDGCEVNNSKSLGVQVAGATTTLQQMHAASAAGYPGFGSHSGKHKSRCGWVGAHV
jgi:hypothetical protein